MSYSQADLFAQDDAERNKLSESQRFKIRSRLEATLARLEAAATFPWRDPLDAVHEENRFQRDAEMLGEEGALLWGPVRQRDGPAARDAVLSGCPRGCTDALNGSLLELLGRRSTS
jgi:hypothetical protein